MENSQIASEDRDLWFQADDSATIDTVDSENPRETLSERVLHIVKLCWKRRRMLVAIVVAGILFSLAYALSLPNIYTSVTSLMPPDNSSSYSGIMSLLSAPGASGLSNEALGLNTPGELFVAILQSRTVQETIVRRFDLVRVYKTRRIEDARRALDANTEITTDRKSGIITIAVKAQDPNLAAKIASAYVEELNHVVSNQSTSSARREREFLEARLKGVKQELDDATKALSQFSVKSKAIDVDAQAKSMVEAQLKLEGELSSGRSELAGLRQIYSGDNSRVKAEEARLTELQRELNAMGGITRKSESTKPDTDEAHPTISELSTLGPTYYDLVRTIRADEALWDALTKEYEAAKVDEVKEIPTVKVLDLANVPSFKSAPRRSLIMIAGTNLSLVFACFCVCIANFWQEADDQSEPKKSLTRVAKELNRKLRRAKQNPDSAIA
jgi:uncharacterized protein involved in exopolysaccharide biosynthesis